MLEEILIAGFGGQGVILAGHLLGEAALAEGKEVACTVSYGPEMRGGTAYASVIISDEPIGSLVVSRPTVAIVMNGPSMIKFEPVVGRGGLLIVNQSLIPNRSPREDIKAVYVPATDLALKLGNKAVANLILIGALLAVRPIVAAAALGHALETMMAKEHPDLLEINMRALRLGMEWGEPVRLVLAG